MSNIGLNRNMVKNKILIITLGEEKKVGDEKMGTNVCSVVTGKCKVIFLKIHTTISTF